ncbi:MAG: hypothetical protein VR73_07780 [Gammaproteobacteria bacterium BRH_c0]|nr:MAG: hypothetical protein VR73_07780 [Gammaproteobacteria bacterium BRH_c0]
MEFLNALYQSLWRVQQQLPKPVSRSLYKRMARRGIAPDYPFVTDFYGVTYRGNLSNNIDFNIYYYGAFEKSLLHFMGETLQNIAPEGGVFVDVGANVGQHSLYMQRLAKTVIAFEPYEAVRRQLLDQVHANGISHIEVQALGLSNENARLPFYAPTGSNEGIGSFDASTLDKGNRLIGELELVRGDDFFAARSDLTIDLMKIDVEGFEKLALEGLQQTLAKNRPLVICEITYDTPLSFQSLAQIQAVFPDNYHLLTFDTRKPDGSKARRREARARASGAWKIIPYDKLLHSGQDDIIACPAEWLDKLPMESAGR